jgi:hypothetical protein
VKQGKQALLFLKKKQQKNFGPFDRGGDTTRGPDEQTFFAAFFQKRSAFLDCLAP